MSSTWSHTVCSMSMYAEKGCNHGGLGEFYRNSLFSLYLAKWAWTKNTTVNMYHQTRFDMVCAMRTENAQTASYINKLPDCLHNGFTEKYWGLFNLCRALVSGSHSPIFLTRRVFYGLSRFSLLNQHFSLWPWTVWCVIRTDFCVKHTWVIYPSIIQHICMYAVSICVAVAVARYNIYDMDTCLFSVV